MNTGTSADVPHIEAYSGSGVRSSADWVLWACLLLTGIGIGVAGLYIIDELQPRTAQSAARAAAEGAPNALGLRVETRRTDLLLSWTPGAPAITSATQGMLSIQTNNLIQNMVLTPDQLRSGRIVYSPKTNAEQIDIRLQVEGPNEPVVEHAILILPAAGVSPEPSPARAESDRNVTRREAAANRPPESKMRLWSRRSAVVLAREASAAAEFQKSPRSLTKLTKTGVLFTVPRGTAVAPGEMEAGFLKVRIMEGAHAGQEGWIQPSQTRRK